MSTAQYIPAGRTSRVISRDSILQVQTEYAARPKPRITTTIINSGRVLKKIERELDQPVSSFEEQRRVEITIKQQHSEICSILDSKAKEHASTPAPPPQPERKLRPVEQIQAVPGVQRVYRLDNEGNLDGPDSSREFQKVLGPVLNHLHELLEIFVQVPGIGLSRESGVYEIERNRLYLISLGMECLIVLVAGLPPDAGFEEAFRKALVKSMH